MKYYDNKQKKYVDITKMSDEELDNKIELIESILKLDENDRLLNKSKYLEFTKLSEYSNHYNQEYSDNLLYHDDYIVQQFLRQFVDERFKRSKKNRSRHLLVIRMEIHYSSNSDYYPAMINKMVVFDNNDSIYSSCQEKQFYQLEELTKSPDVYEWIDVVSYLNEDNYYSDNGDIYVQTKVIVEEITEKEAHTYRNIIDNYNNLKIKQEN